MIVVRIGQLAEQLGVHRNTIRNWINSGRLPARLLSGKRYLISEEDFASLCREFHLERSSLKLKYVPGEPVMSREVAAREENLRPLGEHSDRLCPSPRLGDVCLTCGGCAGVCPISGVDGLDPRKIVRMAVLGLEDELIASSWPWKCTLCGLCEEACPMGVEITGLMMRARGLRDRSRVPGSLQKGLQLHLERGNNMGVPDDDFTAFIEEMAAELSREGVPVDGSPVDRKGARFLVLVNSKIPFAEPGLLKALWKILAVSGESWTVPGRHWEAVNWGIFTGDEEAMRVLTGRVVENMHRLQAEALVLPQ